MAFDITKSINGQAASKAAAVERIQMLPLDMIQANENNFYEISGIRNLAESISIVGLLDPVRVIALPPNGPASGYRLVSGHRRLAAFQLLRAEAQGAEFDRIPTIVMSNLDTLSEEFALLTANATARELSYADKLKQEKAMRETLLAMQAQGKKLPTGLSQYIADSMGTSRNEVSRMHTINEKLVPEAMEKVEAGELNASEAYQLARKPEDLQREAVLNRRKSTVYQSDVAAEEDRVRRETNGILSKMSRASLLLAQTIQDAGSKKEAVAALKGRYRNGGFAGSYFEYSGYPDGMDFAVDGVRTSILSYSQVYDYLALWAIRRLAAMKDANAETAWQAGKPKEPGYYTCKIDNSCKYSVLYWDGEEWLMRMNGATANQELVGDWVPVPKGDNDG